MESTINIHMSVREIENILFIKHGIYKPYGWQIALWMLFNTYNTDTAKVVGFGSGAQFVFPDGSVI